MAQRYSNEAASIPRKEDLIYAAAYIPKKSKTPNRRRMPGSLQINERTQAMATKLKQSVFELTRDDSGFLGNTHHYESFNASATKLPRTAQKSQNLTLQDTTNINGKQIDSMNYLSKTGPESPSVLSVKAHTLMPTVSAKMAFTPTPGSPAKKSPIKVVKKHRV